LGVIERQDFDLVMSDVRMEGLGGLGLLRQLRERKRDTAVVLMTAYATAAQIAEAMSLGAYAFLTKPLSPHDVRLLINRVVDVRTLQREHIAIQHGIDHTDRLPSATGWQQGRPA
jgi:DNA-binding NtrC family response regulator